MAKEITIPRLGWSMEEGTFTEWLKHPGDRVEPGDPLFSVESDKVTMDVEALDAGVLFLAQGAPQPGAVVTVGQCIGYLLADGEAPPDTPTRVPVTPRARRVATELGVDVLQLTGTGKGGRIREQDVRAATPRTPPSLRRTIANRMADAHANTAPVTLMRRVDASRLVALRNRWKLALQPDHAPSFNDLIMKVAAIALAEHPVMMAGAPKINIGLAVDTEQGLIVPIVKDVAGKTIEEVAAQSRTLVQAVRGAALKPEDLTGGVFTITNLGSYGVEAFTPMLHYPETAILGIGAIAWDAVVLPTGQIVARERLTLSLTFDHKQVDGAPAARFLARIAALLEEPPPAIHRP